MNKTRELEGVLVGAGVAAAVGFAQSDNETQRKLRQTRTDVRAALAELEDLETRGDTIRARLPLVQDCQVGLAISNAPSSTPSVVPSTPSQTRPDLANSMEVAVADMRWPPRSGTYTERGFVEEIGEMTALFTSLTFEESRAFLQGLIQSKQPKEAQKLQVFYAANALIKVVYGLNLTWQNYVDAWTRLFQGAGGSTSAPTADPHKMPSKPPTIVSFDPGISSVMPLGTPDIGNFPFAHLNTDQASKWRVTVGAGNIIAGTVIFQVQFGTSYTQPGIGGAAAAYQPVVLAQYPLVYAANVTNSGFSVRNQFGLSAGSIVDVAFTAMAGQQ